MVIVMSTGSPTVTVPSGVGSAWAEDDQRPADQVRIERLPDRRCLPMLVPVLAMFLIGMWRIDRPSFWRDESVTVLVSGQSPADIVGYVRNTDAVHGAYYLLMHLITEFGQSELIARLPSVLAAALAAGGITVIGRRLVSARAGLLAGLIFGLLPVVSRYAQEARSYSIVSAVAVLATYLLLSALATTTGRITWFGCRTTTSFARIGRSPTNNFARPRRTCSRMRGLTGLSQDKSGPFMCTKPVDQPASAWAAISSARLCEVPPGNRRSDNIRTSTCCWPDGVKDLIGSMGTRD